MKKGVVCQGKLTTRYEGRFWASIADNNYHLKCYMKKGNLKITLSNKKLIGIPLGATIREGDWEKFGMEEN